MTCRDDPPEDPSDDDIDDDVDDADSVVPDDDCSRDTDTWPSNGSRS